MRYLVLVAIVVALNVLPAFAPPTWIVLVFYKLNSNLNTVAIIIIGVFSAAVGRYILARCFLLIRERLPVKYSENLLNLKKRLTSKKRIGTLYLFLFALSPLPSAQLFEAAALADAPLIPITVAFMSGRAISYTTSVLGASTLKRHGLSGALLDSMKSPWGIGLQLLCLAAIYLVMKIDWSRGRNIT
jgi:hypothetical protein